MTSGGPEPPPAAGETDPARPARPLGLTILLGVILVTNTLGLSRGIAAREALLSEIPRLTPTLWALWLAAAVLAIAGALGLWNLRRWGLYLVGLGWAVAVVVDLMVGATQHAFLATGVMWLVVLFVRPVRGALR